jgi:hypothetical protein
VLAVRPEQNRPQLLSTSRHITQGIVDIVEETWDAQTRTLRGRSKVVGGDPYELRIVANNAAWRAGSVELSPADRDARTTATVKQEPDLLRVTLAAPKSREVAWAVQFK